MSPQKKKESDKARFIRVARELGCEETGEKFLEKLVPILAAKPIKNKNLKKLSRKKKIPL